MVRRRNGNYPRSELIDLSFHCLNASTAHTIHVVCFMLESAFGTPEEIRICICEIFC
ncbi:hypothetical protein LEP1GSC165_0024 [Leptospira santarosai str. CBC523]|nr:hypothetical protein LEP1GSC165_0024 [Leptospira santarosai str. CBC523]